MNDSKIKDTMKMYADIKTRLCSMWKNTLFLTRKGRYNIGLFSVYISQNEFLTRLFADISTCRNLPT